ncbi:5-formyltetrahydrofolate cyclo-ligase [Alcanivorax sp. 1008]|uniref:5-formyltetrahydrofolate cyclo-ligase n=1 Tax=Alcanivorax sp. 1008 TaxID=2816853 RepID=UPI001DE4E509|nr:5-formyltetrahydrofolate cyclo-ligase [Alcanivorax sp. 1008]MCC1497417.1 5-formyltetrahydrofolate cyclo-ligase [Alcanivorax sp. 1008]
MALSAAEQQRRQQLRRDMRSRRQALSPKEQRAASNRLAHNLCNLLMIRRARRVGVYLASDGELDPLPALLTSDNPPRTLYLPILPRHADAALHFAPWAPGEVLVANRYEIGEPTLKHKSLAPLWSLDVLLMPLVAFDQAGNRLGMGGGFYDRALANLIRQPKRPHLIGVAHAFQKVKSLPAAPWDQPLDDVITD